MRTEQRLNRFGDVVARGHFKNNKLSGRGCKYDPTFHGWIKSPHFIDDSVYGLAVIFDVNDDIVFYGIMYNDKIVREEIVYHAFLASEYNLVQDPPDYIRSVVKIIES